MEKIKAKFAVRALDSHTNEVLAGHPSINIDLMNGERRIECSYETIQTLQKSRSDLNLNFEVFINQGVGWKIWKLQPKHFHRIRAKIKAQIAAKRRALQP